MAGSTCQLSMMTLGNAFDDGEKFWQKLDTLMDWLKRAFQRIVDRYEYHIFGVPMYLQLSAHLDMHFLFYFSQLQPP
jgi:anaerobic ribonucleoside-triphosphate reductase